MIIEAANILRERKFEFEIWILGEGSERKSLERLVGKYNLEAYVSLLGFKRNPYKYLKRADAFLMSSVSEALPTVLCEAMILGKPVLVSNCSGCRELVNFGEFGLISEREPIEFANYMCSLIENEVLRKEFQLKSRERCEIFDDEIIVQQYLDIFNA